MLKLNNVSLYRQTIPLLTNINWHVHKGEHWALLGLNGSGKTTLLKVITGYLWASAGSVEIFGSQYGKVNVQNVRKRIGWVSDSLDDRYRTRQVDRALDVVLSGKFASIGLHEPVTAEDIDRAVQMMDEFQISAVKEMPFFQLSQGEKKRVMLARAWMAKPELLLLDEPCSGLDVRGREQFLALLAHITKQPGSPTIIYVTHHIEEVLPFITHVHLLKDGKTVAQGDKKAMLTGDKLTAVFQVPVDVTWEQERPWLRVTDF